VNRTRRPWKLAVPSTWALLRRLPGGNCAKDAVQTECCMPTRQKTLAAAAEPVPGAIAIAARRPAAAMRKTAMDPSPDTVNSLQAVCGAWLFGLIRSQVVGRLRPRIPG
jgi:hypothetical protein